MLTARELWDRYREYLNVNPSIGLTVDISRMGFPDSFLSEMTDPMTRAFGQMDALEKGEIANPDEQRMVGHYWLRAAGRAPDAAMTLAITRTLERIHAFTADVHAGKIA